MVNAQAKVRVKQHLDGHISIWADKVELDFTLVDNYVHPEKPKLKTTTLAKKQSKPRSHQFRHYKPEKARKTASKSRQLDAIGPYYGNL